MQPIELPTFLFPLTSSYDVSTIRRAAKISYRILNPTCIPFGEVSKKLELEIITSYDIPLEESGILDKHIHQYKYEIKEFVSHPLRREHIRMICILIKRKKKLAPTE